VGRLLTSLPESPLPEAHRPPGGRWILCGYGRFGRVLAPRLQAAGITLTIIDPAAAGASHDIVGDGTEAATLSQAGIESASGIIAGSDNDVNNLSIAVTASELMPGLFVVARQNQATNSPLFDAYGADFTMVPSQVIAKEALAILTTPLLARFLEQLRGRDEAWSAALAARLRAAGGERTPAVRDVS
jgi:Trk K+ transport system NAD-binding subunit